MLQTFRYFDVQGDCRGIAVGTHKRTETEEDGTTTVFILNGDAETFVACFLLLPGESVSANAPDLELTAA